MVNAAIESRANVFIVACSIPGFGWLPLRLARVVRASTARDRWSAAHSESYILLRWPILVGICHSNRDDRQSPRRRRDNAGPRDRDTRSSHERAFRRL